MGEPTESRREGMSDQALIEGTGATWATWLQLLDERDASSLDHAAIARTLMDQFGLDGWWAQSVAVEYERERGLREPGRRPDGTYTATASITVPVGAADAFEWVADADRHRHWLGALTLAQHNASPPGSVSFDASDGSRVLVDLASEGETTTVRVAIARLASASDASAATAAWKERLARLAAATQD